MISTIAFDLDGTLYDENSYVIQAYRFIANFISKIDQEEILEFMINCRCTEGDSCVLQRVIERYNIEAGILPKLIDIYRCCNAELHLFKDADSFFKQEKLCRYYLLSNGSGSTQINKIHRLEIEAYFEQIIITGQYLNRKYWKPQKESFELLNKICSIPLESCLYVGDSVEKDIQGAINAGMKACLINRNQEEAARFNGSFWMANSMESIRKIVEYENK